MFKRTTKLKDLESPGYGVSQAVHLTDSKPIVIDFQPFTQKDGTQKDGNDIQKVYMPSGPDITALASLAVIAKDAVVWANVALKKDALDKIRTCSQFIALDLESKQSLLFDMLLFFKAHDAFLEKNATSMQRLQEKLNKKEALSQHDILTYIRHLDVIVTVAKDMQEFYLDNHKRTLATIWDGHKHELKSLDKALVRHIDIFYTCFDATKNKLDRIWQQEAKAPLVAAKEIGGKISGKDEFMRLEKAANDLVPCLVASRKAIIECFRKAASLMQFKS